MTGCAYGCIFFCGVTYIGSEAGNEPVSSGTLTLLSCSKRSTFALARDRMIRAPS